MEGIKTFVASDPVSISSGGDWFSEILENLSNAYAIVIVYSRNARSRMWVGFELGYFWRKYNGNNIHCVFDSHVELPSPLNERQAKDFADVAAMAVFFRGLASDLACKYQADEIRITQIVDSIPQFDSFATWRSFLANGEWSKEVLTTEHGHKSVWTSLDDMTYQIEDPHVVEVEHFSEPWVKRFPDPHASSRWINLNISGVTIKQELFVSLDGGRYFVPIPEIAHVGDKWEPSDYKYYYDRKSLRFLLGKVIGRFYSFVKNLEEFSARQGIDIR